MTSRFAPPHLSLAALPFVVPLLLALGVLAFLTAALSWGTLPPAVLLPEAGAEFVAGSSARAEPRKGTTAPPESPVFADRPAEAAVQGGGLDPLRPRPVRRPRP